MTSRTARVTAWLVLMAIAIVIGYWFYSYLEQNGLPARLIFVNTTVMAVAVAAIVLVSKLYRKVTE